ncbi:MAG: hypothetical protein EA376_12605 [Phycisphaeraceae bacterium]|nr:MAG: hypothetical protein EA376_12605 [Phycisphaeraceae bacterium]
MLKGVLVVNRSLPLRVALIVGLLAGGYAIAKALVGRAAAGAPDAQAIQQDLALELRLLSDQVIPNYQAIEVELTLVNTSEDAAYHVVLPGDGSWKRWREPHMQWRGFFAGEDGSFQRHQFQPFSRCRQHHPDWRADIVLLQPGERRRLSAGDPRRFFQKHEAGTWELRVHYEYMAKPARSGLGEDSVFPDETAFGEMRGTPPFELVSNPISFDVVAPLEMEVTVIGELPVNEPAPLSELVRIELNNRSEAPVELLPLGGDRLRSGIRAILWVTPEDRRFKTIEAVDPPAPAAPYVLAPGETVSMLGDPRFASDFDAIVQFEADGDAPESVSVKIHYSRTGWAYRIVSDSVEIPVR